MPVMERMPPKVESAVKKKTRQVRHVSGTSASACQLCAKRNKRARDAPSLVYSWSSLLLLSVLPRAPGEPG